MDITAIAEGIRALLIFLLFFCIFPLIFMKKSKSDLPMLDRFFFGFVCIVFYQVVLSHLLALIKLFDVVSIVILTIATIFLIVKTDKQKELLITRFIFRLYRCIDAVESKTCRQAFIHDIKCRISGSCSGIPGLFAQARKKPVFVLLFCVVFLLSALVRMWHALQNYAYPHLDMYLHLKWVKALMSNDLFYNNAVYPKGMHAFLAFVSRLTFSDSYWILRFFGPFFTILLVLSIYYFAKKVTGNRYASLLAMAIFGLTVDSNLLPEYLFRQTATMPQEFGMLFVVLGFSFLIDFIHKPNIRALFCFEACLLIALMSHSFSGAFLIFFAAVTVCVSLLNKKISFKQSLRFVGISALVSAATFMPLIIGRLLGNVFHESSFEMLTDVTGLQIADLYFRKYFTSLIQPGSYLMSFMVFGVIFLAVASFFIRRRSYEPDSTICLSVAVLSVILYCLYHMFVLIGTDKLPELIDQSRIGPFLSIVLPVTVSLIALKIGKIVSLIFSKKSDKNYLLLQNPVMLILILFFMIRSITTGSYTLNTFYRHMEYNQAAKASTNIKAEYYKASNEIGNWYVVSTDPQMAQVLNYGWYEEGYQFVHKYTKEQVMNPSFRFDEYPVNNLYLFVEKKPIFYGEHITTEFGEKELEPLGDDPFMQYYQEGQNRAIMEGHIWMIAKSYADTHDGVSIYYEDEDFMIYKIYQKGVFDTQ